YGIDFIVLILCPGHIIHLPPDFGDLLFILIAAIRFEAGEHLVGLDRLGVGPLAYEDAGKGVADQRRLERGALIALFLHLLDRRNPRGLKSACQLLEWRQVLTLLRRAVVSFGHRPCPALAGLIGREGSRIGLTERRRSPGSISLTLVDERS